MKDKCQPHFEMLTFSFLKNKPALWEILVVYKQPKLYTHGRDSCVGTSATSHYSRNLHMSTPLPSWIPLLSSLLFFRYFFVACTWNKRCLIFLRSPSRSLPVAYPNRSRWPTPRKCTMVLLQLAYHFRGNLNRGRLESSSATTHFLLLHHHLPSSLDPQKNPLKGNQNPTFSTMFYLS